MEEKKVSLKKVKAETHTVGDGKRGGKLFTSLPFLACSATFCINQSHLPRDGTVHCGLGPPTPISNQENASQT